MTELIFIVDPMCSWCWGFHPIIEELRQKQSQGYKFSLLMGGLRTTGQMSWDSQSKAYLAQNWNNVSAKTGQRFTHTLLNKPTFDYNTYPSCKAVITVRELWGEVAAFEYIGSIQKAFYVDARDITSIEILTSHITQDKEKFLDFYNLKQAEQLMQHDFSKARSMGANAFPSTIKIDSEGHMVCLNGYRPLEEILKI